MDQKNAARYVWLATKHHSVREVGPEKIRILVGEGINRSPGPLSEACQQLVFVHHKVNNPEEFADRFGLLGYVRIVSDPTLRRGGDPLDWFLAHANTAALILDLIGRYQNAEETNFQVKGPIAYGETIDRPTRILFSPKTTIREQAYAYLRQLLNPNIEHAPTRIFPVDMPPSIFKPLPLVDLIYHQMADLLDCPGSVRRRCERCGHFFIGRDPRQRFCPPPISSRRSRCSSLHNVRIFRAGRGRV